jgi:hypothetical protein
MYSLSSVLIARWRVELKVLLGNPEADDNEFYEAVQIYKALRDQDAAEGIEMPATLLVRAAIEGWL